MLKQSKLTSIPERNEIEDEPCQKWVPKKKHEVLKAKYKCLKKLFQIYDATNNSTFLPEPVEYAEESTTKRRRKRSHRTKTDACADTSELPSGDIIQTEPIEYDNAPAKTEITRDLKTNQSCFTQIENSKVEMNEDISRYKYAGTNDSKEDLSRKASYSQCKCELPHPLVLNERRKLTRFQCFVQRLFGIRRDSHSFPIDAYATVSDSQRERWRRRGLRFRRVRRVKKIKSETDIIDMKNPAIISFVQSVQRNYLTDTTPKQCPILGCGMIPYGIINYNDHINLCHFKHRKFICFYCHEGFVKAYDKYTHENEHLGLSQLSTNLPNIQTRNKSSNINTQTDPELRIPEEKLKKIVSFFDKFSDHEDILTEIRKRSSDTNLTKTEIESSSGSQNSSEKSTVSCLNIHKCKCESTNSSVTSQVGRLPVTCLYCGKTFDYTRQLRCHVDMEHKMPKCLKSYSCTGIGHDPRQQDLHETMVRQDLHEESLPRAQRDSYTEPCSRRQRELVFEDGRLNVLSIAGSRMNQTYTEITSPSPSEETITQTNEESLTFDPSTNIVYYSSLESLNKPSVIESLLKKVRSYKWVSNTKIIHV